MNSDHLDLIESVNAEQDVVNSYDVHANCYIQKPVDFDRFVEVIQMIGRFWFDVVKLPPR